MRAATALAAALLAFVACSRPPDAADSDRPAERKLSGMYSDFNARYFDGKLAEIRVVWDDALAAEPSRTGTQILGLWVPGPAERRAIVLNPRLKGDPAGLRRVLAHEMIHEAMFERGHAEERHGPLFRAELRRIWLRKAFDGKPPSPGELEALRAWLSAKRPVLEALEKELLAKRAAMRDSPTAGQARDYNELVAMHNGFAVEFQRQAQRYNELTVFPDGSDPEPTPQGLSAQWPAQRSETR